MRFHPCRTSLSAAVALAMTSLSPAVLAVDFIFSDGTFVPGSTAPSPLVAGQVLQINTGGFKFFNGTSFTNQSGVVNWNADAIYMQSGATINNQSLWDARSDNTLYYNGGAATTFNNTGTFRKSAGAGDTTIANVSFVNSGTIDAQTGRIVFSGGNVNFNAGSNFVGAASTVIANNASFNGAFTSSNLNLANGYFTGNNAVVNGTVAFTGGAITGSWEVAAGQTLSARDGGFKFVDGAATALTNKGTIDWATANALYLQNGGQVVNRGLFLASESTAMHYNGGAATAFVNQADGTIRAAAGKTLTIGNAGLVNNGGTLDAAAGGSIVYAGGNVVFNDGTKFTGAGLNRVVNNAAFNGRFEAGNLVLEDGFFQGTAAVVNGNASFAGGALTGGWEVAAGHTLTARDGGFKYVNGTASVLTNKGTIDWATSGALYLQSGGQVVNRGLFVASESTAMHYNGGAATAFVNEADGTIRAAAGKTLTIGNAGLVNNGGTLNAAAGASIVYSGGNAVFNDGTRFTGAGSNVVSNNSRFVGGFTSENLNLQGGFFTGGDGATPGSKAILAGGTATLSGGSLVGVWQVNAGSTLAVANGGFKYIEGAGTVVSNQGTMTSGTAIYLQSGGRFENQGRFEFQGDGAFHYNGGALPTFVNTGLITKTGGAGTAVIGDNLAFDNQGVVSVTSGTIQLPGNFGNNGTLTGTGAFATSQLTNAGHVAAGDGGAGTLTLNGNFVQGLTGSLDTELATSSAFDLFKVNGTAALHGTLALSCILTCDIHSGDVFTILDSTGDLTGTFDSVTTAGFLNGFDYSVVYDYDADLVKLMVINAGSATPPPIPSPVPEPGTWAMMFAGLGVMGALARRRGRSA